MPASGKGPLRVAIEDFLETFSFGKRIAAWLRSSVEAVEDELLGDYRELFDQLEQVPDLPAPLRRFIGRSREQRQPLGIVAAGGLVMGVVAIVGFAAAQPLARLITYFFNRIFKPERVEPGLGWQMIRRGPQFEAMLRDGFAALGWTDKHVEAFQLATEQRHTPQEAVSLWLRGAIGDKQLEYELSSNGWTAERIAHFRALSQVIPGVADLVQMAVREAFDDQVSARFEHDRDFPAELAEWAERQGLSREWSQRYWRAHWQLPGLGQAYEMLHRLRPGRSPNPVTVDDLRTLIRTADLAPFWRDRLIEISYQPYTRVDVRRMYEAHVLDEAAVYESYRDLGYDDLHARNLTDWTTRDTHAPQKELTRDALLRAYRRRMFTRDQAAEHLAAVGYDAQEVEFWLGLIDLEQAQARAQTVIDGVEQLYVAGAIDEPAVYGRLGPLNLPATEISELLRDWTARRAARVDLPTKAELESFYQRAIIDQARYRAGLLERRVRADQAEWYIQRADQELAEAARKELERAQKEQERLSTAAAASDFARGNAALDTEIAEVRLAISNVRLALVETVDPAEQKGLARQVLEYQILIAELAVEKAQLKVVRAASRGAGG